MEQLTKEEYESLRKLENWCYDTMSHATISPRILSILLDIYEESLKK